ncbi:IAA-alanine resistance protein 1 [Carex littledalei]|uniref:IAA-alanine resistance protein 1 n=1 Tax=Carex littledalei TaxID=544730 RepID=A0A833QRD2_9POAL|nr:IAA-alanine resistance protein 1 [Carex littledalei]
MAPDCTFSRRSHSLLSLLLFSLFFTTVISSGCGHDHHHDHGHDHDHDHHHHHKEEKIQTVPKLPEELAEEMDLALEGFDNDHDHGHGHAHQHQEHRHHYHGIEGDTSHLGIWMKAMGCSLLVSMASLICLVLLPVIFSQGKPSKAVVDCLAVFGAGAMLGDAFLHQLPHAFGGGHSHAHVHDDHNHKDHAHEHAHAHSLEDLSNGLSVLFGIVLFFIVEKVVRYVDEHYSGYAHHHHHHLHNKQHGDANENSNQEITEKQMTDGEKTKSKALRKRGSSGAKSSSSTLETVNNTNDISSNKSTQIEKEETSSSSLVFGYLNLISDGVHNFTDGMALGSAFLLHGSVGGWSRTLFLLAHELPQEVGDFGILVHSGFTVTKALFFNFLSALVALAGTALALMLGKDPGHSSLIEGFTAGGFIYIAVAGVIPEMNTGKTTIKSTAIQLTSLLLGMLVALCISLVE